jgi:transposase
VARPTKRTPELERRLLDALRAGNTRRAACAYAGVEQHTFQRWLLRFAHFAQAIEKAEADAAVRNVAIIQQAARDGTWTAAAWWLERRYPEDYGRRERVDVTIRQQAERIAHELGLDATELIAEAERIARGGVQ